MDNQPSYQIEQPVVSQPQGAPQQPKTTHKRKVLLPILLIAALLGLGYLGFVYKSTNDTLHQKSVTLSKAYATIQDFQKIIDQNKASTDFESQYNNADLSRNLCLNASLGMFDVHVNDKFAVFRYLCANQSEPIRVGAMKKLPSGTYEFTYGSSAIKPNELPSYIFDTEPSFFGPVYGTTRF